MASSTDATGNADDGAARAGTPTSTPTIRTPDQRLRVFISSTLGELADERAAARAAIDDLRLVPVMFELGARPHPPRDLYRAYLAQSHVFVGIYWQRYGWIAPDMEISGLEDEYLLAAEHPKLIYIKSPAPDRDPALERLLDRIRDDNNASYRSFTTAEELGELLENDLAVLLTERFEATDLGNGDGATNADVPDGRAGTIPVDTSPLVGRDEELRELLSMFACHDTRLVTLTGPGGCGKTRLAVRIAELAQEELGQRVCFVDLSSVRDPSRVLTTIASAIGVRDVGSRRLVDAITSLLRDAPRMLVLDNFEHVIDAAADIAEILSATTDVPILVTSREALRLRWEQEYPVRPLPVPEEGQSLDPSKLEAVAAVELFVERARRVQASFALTDANAGVVAEICRRLDGLPLAIELAAARMRVLSADELLARLEHRLDTLRGGWLDAPDRHRALREAIGWSHDLLGPDEQRVFRRIAAFAGGCSLEAVEAVCGDASTSDDVLEILASLVDKSLVVSAVDPITMHTRFSLLETVREYGLERLVESGEEDAVRGRHLEYHHSIGERAAEKMHGPETAAWLDLLDREHDNLRAALDFAIPSGNAQLGLELASNLRVFWDIRGHYREAIKRYRALIDAMPDEPSVLRGRARDAVGWLTGMTGDYVTALEWLRAGCAEVRAAGDPVALARSIAEQAIVMCNLFLIDEAEVLLREGRPLADASGDPYLVAMVTFGQSQVALFRGDLDTAVQGFEQCLALARDIDEPWSLAWTLAVAGAWHVATSDAPRARAELSECLALRRRLRDDRGTADCLGLLACLASAEGEFEWAARLHGAAEIGQEANAVTIWPFFEPLHEQSVQRVRDALGAAKLDELWRRGRSTPMHEIVTEALDESRYAHT